MNLKPNKKPNIFDLMNQISEWRDEKLKELNIYERKEEARENAKEIFS